MILSGFLNSTATMTTISKHMFCGILVLSMGIHDNAATDATAFLAVIVVFPASLVYFKIWFACRFCADSRDTEIRAAYLYSFECEYAISFFKNIYKFGLIASPLYGYGQAPMEFPNLFFIDS